MSALDFNRPPVIAEARATILAKHVENRVTGRIITVDQSQFDKASHHYDPASVSSAPRWDMVDVRYRQTFKTSVSLDRLRQEPKLKGMVLLQKGSRLSVQPVTEAEWVVVLKLAGAKVS